MRRTSWCASALLALVVGAVQPLAAQTNPLDIFVGPLRQWTFSQCQTGRIPNADRTGVTTGQQFCVEGLLTLGTHPPERSFNNPADPAATVTFVSWIAQINTTPAPGVLLLNFDLDALPSLTYTKGGLGEREARSGIVHDIDETARFIRQDCVGVGCSSTAPLTAFAPTSLRLIYEHYLDAPCQRPMLGCPQFFEPPQTGIVVTSFQAVTVTPEPSTYALLGTGLLAIGGSARRRKRAARS